MKITIKTSIRKDLIKSDGKARLDFMIYYQGKPYRVSSEQMIEPEFWNSKLGYVDKKSPDALEINKYLTEKVANFDKFIKTKEILNEEILLEDLKAVLKGQSVEKKIIQARKHPSISEAFNSYVANKELKPATKRNYAMTKKILNEFCKKKYPRKITINDIDFCFLENFKKYLRVERKNNKNSSAKRFKVLKSVVFYAINQGHIEKNPFRGYKIEHGKPNDTVLSEDEYSRFITTKLPKNACNSMRLTKDIFVFCCETGLRYSDVMDLRWEHIDENMTSISKIQIKTEREVYIPLSNQAKAIMIKYKEKFKKSKNDVFPYIENQTMNRNLKIIAENAKIDKILTTHVARHTFATLLGTSGLVSAFTLSKLMGHSGLAMTQRYVHSSNSDSTNAMERVWEQRRSA